MKFELIFVGKTTEKYLQEGIETYFLKLKHYVKTEIVILSPKRMNAGKTEGKEEIIKHIDANSFIVLLDENGKQLSSVALSKQIEKWMNQSYKKIVFVVGGAYGVDEEIKEYVDFVLSLSNLTFTHQMIRLILIEQLYRVMTISKGESYHHE